MVHESKSEQWKDTHPSRHNQEAVDRFIV
jgi:hypothetical protein